MLLSFDLYAGIWEDFSAPVHYDDSQKVLLIGASATLITVLFKNTFEKKMQNDLQEDRPFCCHLTDPGNKYLQILPNIFYTIGFGFDFYFNSNEESKRRAIGMTKATIYSDLITEILKRSANEKRPNGGGLSFPSGHTTSAFAFASFVASEHPWYIGIPAYVMASYVGFCRMHDNHHYLHDVMAGATIGMSYGISLSLNSKNNENPKSALLLSPTEEFRGLALRYSLKF